MDAKEAARYQQAYQAIKREQKLQEQLAESRAWSTLWKNGARHYRARLHTAANIAAKYIMEASKAKDRVVKLEQAMEQACITLAQSRTAGSGVSYRKSALFVEGLLDGMLEDAEPWPSCLWQYDERIDAWETGCGATWVLNDGTPADNEMLFCPACGKRVDEGEDYEYESTKA